MSGEQQQNAAPKLELDAAGLDSFHKWYKSLPQVRFSLIIDSSTTNKFVIRPIYTTFRNQISDLDLFCMQDGHTVRFFDRKTCYSVHGDHAFMIARYLYKSTAQITYIGNNNKQDQTLPGITLSYNLFPTLIKELLVDRAEHTIEVYEGASSSWNCTKQGSPGMWRDFESILSLPSSDITDTPIVASITMGTIDGIPTIGVAYADTTSRKLGACQFADDDHFCHLETVLTQLGAREAVLPIDLLPDTTTTTTASTKENASSNHNTTTTTTPSATTTTITTTTTSKGISKADKLRLADVLARCNILASNRPRQLFNSSKSLVQDLGRLLRVHFSTPTDFAAAGHATVVSSSSSSSSTVEVHRPVLELPLASAALAGLIAFTEILSDDAAHKRYSLELYNTGKYMRIDAAAQRALNILKSRTDAAESFSLYGLMNKAKTPMGKRLLKSWLKQPLVDPGKISERHDVVDAFVADASLRSDVSGLHLRGMPDIDRLVRKLEKKTATLQDLCQLYRVAARIPQITACLKDHSGDCGPSLHAKFVRPLEEAHDPDHLGKFEELLEAAVDLDRIPDEYLIAATYDEGLEEIKEEKAAVEDDIQKLAAAAADDLGLVLDKTVKLEWHKQSNQRIRCLRITAKEEKVVRKTLQAKYIELETRKDGIKFTNRALRTAAERLQQLSQAYDSKQAALVQQVVAVASTFCEVWEAVSTVMGEMDVLCGFAELACSAPSTYVRPTMLPSKGRVFFWCFLFRVVVYWCWYYSH